VYIRFQLAPGMWFPVEHDSCAAFEEYAVLRRFVFNARGPPEYMIFADLDEMYMVVYDRHLKLRRRGTPTVPDPARDEIVASVCAAGIQ
jgi:hypothetical protein